MADAASELSLQKKHVFKLLDRLGIPKRLERRASARGQKVAVISQGDFRRLKEHASSTIKVVANSDIETSSYGAFYLIQLEPTLDPGRFKLGFATNLEERLRAHKTAAPLCILRKSWPCKLLWEKTAIDAISNGCEQVHTEVFRHDPIEEIIDRCERFFSLMPNV